MFPHHYAVAAWVRRDWSDPVHQHRPLGAKSIRTRHADTPADWQKPDHPAQLDAPRPWPGTSGAGEAAVLLDWYADYDFF